VTRADDSPTQPQDVVSRRPPREHRGGVDRHRRPGHHRHAGAAAGEAASRGLLRRRRPRERHGGMQLSARRGRRDERGGRVRPDFLGAGLWRHRVRPGLLDDPPAPPPSRDGARPVRRRGDRPHARRAVAPPRPDPPAGAALRTGLVGPSRDRARVPPFRGHLRAGLGQRLPRSHPSQPVQRRLLHPTRPRPSPGAPTTAPARCTWSDAVPRHASRTGCRAETSTPISPWPR